MDGMVDENGTPATDPLAPSPDPPTIVSSVGFSSADSPAQPHLVTATNIVHLTLPTHTSAQVQSVIQPNQQSVIQTATNLQHLQCKGNVILLGKPNSVIQTAQGSLQALQVVETASDDSCYSEEESPKRRRDLLTRRPSYRKILNELGGGEIADNRAAVAAAASASVGGGGGRTNGGATSANTTTTAALTPTTPRRNYHINHYNNNSSSSSAMVFTTKVEQTSEGDSEFDEGENSLSSLTHAIPYHTVIPAGAIQISSGEGGQSIHTLTMTNSGASGAIVQYAQGQEFFVPVVAQSGSLSSGGGSGGADGESRKQLRLLKNREAARECRRKKKEYIKCLENRVAVLENQNKALIDELKTLKELYCQQKIE